LRHRWTTSKFTLPLIAPTTASCCRTFFFSSSAANRDLHSFPTRRSSDLWRNALGDRSHAGLHGGGRSDACGRPGLVPARASAGKDRKSTRLNSSHLVNSYAVFCLKKKMHKEFARQWLSWLLVMPATLSLE